MNCKCECKMLNITAGTDITLAVTLRRDGELFPVELSDNVKVNMVSQRGVRFSVSCRVGTGKVVVPLLGEDFSVGVYGVEVTGKLNGANWRTFGASVVKYTYETQRGAARVIANGDTYDIELEVGTMSDIVPHSLSELDSDPEHRTVTDDEKERWNQGGGKINIVKVDGEPLDIDPTDKSVDIDLSSKVDKVAGKGLSTNDYTNEEKTKLADLQNYDDTAVRDLINDETQRAQEVEQQLNFDINAQAGRINTAINNLETAKTEKIAEMDAARVATETATAAANTATENANAATQATNAAIEKAENVNATLDTETNIVTITDKGGASNSIDLTNKTNASLNGSVVTITDKEGNESEIDLLNATNERVYVNVTAEDPERIVSGIVVNCFLNNDVDEPLQATTNENGQCYFDIPNNYRYRLVFPTRTGCDPITDVTHIAHASQRIVDVQYKEHVPQPEVGEKLTVVVQKSVSRVSTKMPNVEVRITYDDVARVYTTDANGEVAATIPYGKDYTITMPELEGLFLKNGKYVYRLVAEQSRRTYAITYNDYEIGVFIVCPKPSGEGIDKYTLNEFVEAREAGTVQNSDAKAVIIQTDELMNVIDHLTGERKSGVFGLDIDLLRTTNFNTAAWKKNWATADVIFTSIPLKGNGIGTNYYFDGLTASVLVQGEQIDRNVTTDAANFCLGMYLSIGGDNYQGFLGSVGQWQALEMMKGEVDEILVTVRPSSQYPSGTSLYTLGYWSNINKWTSAQYERPRAVTWKNSADLTTYKGSANVAFPFFAF